MANKSKAVKDPEGLFTVPQAAALGQIASMETAKQRGLKLTIFSQKHNIPYDKCYAKMAALKNKRKLSPKGAKERKPWGSNRLSQAKMTVNEREMRFPIGDVRLEYSLAGRLELILTIDRKS